MEDGSIDHRSKHPEKEEALFMTLRGWSCDLGPPSSI